MKNLKIFWSFFALLSFLTFVKCSEDDKAVTLLTLSGKVTYTNAFGTTANAAGAIITLENVNASTTLSTVANATGDYAFENLVAGSYTLSSTYYTANKNVSARLDGLNFSTEADVAVEIASVDVTQNLTLVSTGQSGATVEALAAAYSWNGSAYANTGAWTFDNAHSPVIF